MNKTARMVGTGIVILAENVAVLCLLTLTGAPTKYAPIKHGGNGPDDAVVSSPAFLVVYQGLPFRWGGYMEAIVEGSAAVIPRFQHEDHGFSFQSNGDMDSHHSYSFQSCKATLVFFGRKVMEVGDNGRTLYMQGRQFPLGKDRLVLLVTPEGDFRQLTGAEAKRLEDSLHPWFRTFEHSDYPHELLRRPYQPLP